VSLLSEEQAEVTSVRGNFSRDREESFLSEDISAMKQADVTSVRDFSSEAGRSHSCQQTIQ